MPKNFESGVSGESPLASEWDILVAQQNALDYTFEGESKLLPGTPATKEGIPQPPAESSTEATAPEEELSSEENNSTVNLGQE
jgi:hypothetical protein